jgi:hypothetical protein
VEQLGAGSRSERVEAGLESALKLVGSHHTLPLPACSATAWTQRSGISRSLRDVWPLTIHEAADDGDYSTSNHRVQSDADRGTGEV